MVETPSKLELPEGNLHEENSLLDVLRHKPVDHQFAPEGLTFNPCEILFRSSNFRMRLVQILIPRIGMRCLSTFQSFRSVSVGQSQRML